MYLGAHLSIEGGYHNACLEAKRLSCNTLQIFTKNERQWHAKPVSKEEEFFFKKALSECNIEFVCAHDSYLINLASSRLNLFKKSLASFVHELERANQLGLKYLVTHPGSCRDSNERTGIKNMIKGLNEALDATDKITILLETTAGQGKTLGYRFEQLAQMIQECKQPERIGICFDTCHAFVAGYDIVNKYDEVMNDLNKIIGLEKLLLFHLNDSKKALGSKVDRHEHIGKGFIGLRTFQVILKDERFRMTPKIIETPKEDKMDEINLKILRKLAEEQI